jgi:hypothetical protein
MKDDYFDLCITNGVVRLTALSTYIGAKKLLAGSDCQFIRPPFYPPEKIAGRVTGIQSRSILSHLGLMAPAQKRIYGFQGFSADDARMIRYGNTIDISSSILDEMQGEVITVSAQCLWIQVLWLHKLSSVQ